MTVDSGSTFNADVTFTGANFNCVWDKSDNRLRFADNAELAFGADGDTAVWHDDSNFVLANYKGHIYIQNGGSNDDSDIIIRAKDGENSIYCKNDESVYLYWAGTSPGQRIRTTQAGVTITGSATASTFIGALTGNASTATALQTARTIGGTSVDGTGNITPAQATNADTVDSLHAASFLRSDASDSFTGDLTASGAARLLLKKNDNNISDHIIFYNGTTRVGEIGVQDNTWLRLNNQTEKNIYTPRYIRADAGFFVDGTSKGINGSGNFIGGTIAGASDYSTLLRSNAADTATGDITFSGGGGAVTIAANSDIRFTNGDWTGNTCKIQHHSNTLYLSLIHI